MIASLDIDQYSLPKSDNLFATLATGKIFAKFDLSTDGSRERKSRLNIYISRATPIYMV